MTGQDAVKSAQEFAAALPLTGAILTKLDGDSRGGAALSIRTVAKVPIRYAGVGEKTADLELFSPERMASRILGMGDVLSLIEKAEQGLDRAEAERLTERLARREFTLEDLRDQLRQLKRMGPLSSMLEMLPKVGPLRKLPDMPVDESRVKRVEAIIDSMTPQERRQPGRAQRQPQAAHRARLRHHGAGGQPAPQAVPGHAQDAQGDEGELDAPGTRGLSR